MIYYEHVQHEYVNFMNHYFSPHRKHHLRPPRPPSFIHSIPCGRFGQSRCCWLILKGWIYQGSTHTAAKEGWIMPLPEVSHTVAPERWLEDKPYFPIGWVLVTFQERTVKLRKRLFMICLGWYVYGMMV